MFLPAKYLLAQTGGLSVVPCQLGGRAPRSCSLGRRRVAHTMLGGARRVRRAIVSGVAKKPGACQAAPAAPLAAPAAQLWMGPPVHGSHAHTHAVLLVGYPVIHSYVMSCLLH